MMAGHAQAFFLLVRVQGASADAGAIAAAWIRGSGSGPAEDAVAEVL
uniref:Uncharacterized protein n=1 Tax=Setaria viridis TaxID=4556 RepID=A0A4U6VDR4_SETVI|nr:hypothetical protein SEVIR_3G259933v2 [Setaria viridis]